MASSFHIYEIEGSIRVFNESTFSMKSSLVNSNVAREIKQCNFGLYDEVSSLQNFYLADIASEVSDRLDKTFDYKFVSKVRCFFWYGYCLA